MFSVKHLWRDGNDFINYKIKMTGTDTDEKFFPV